MTVVKGASAPDFSLLDQSGKAHTLGDYRGRWVLLYFYPKDDTPGCTKEACGLRDAFPDFGALDAEVVGVSVDSVASHTKFVTKYHLPFTLLADTEKKVVDMYGVWQLKKMMGREYMGTVRTSFLIDPAGKIAKIYKNVKPAEHGSQVINDLRGFKSSKG